jgi:hypothetical protein
MRWTRVVGVLLAVPWLVGVAAAHEVPGGRLDAPLPLPLLFAGAGFTVAATACWFARDDHTVDERERRQVEVPWLPLGRHLLRAVGLVGFAGVLWFGLFGLQVAADNPATLFAWAVALKGVGLVAVVAGSPWRSLSPWRTAYDAFVALEGDELARFDYPDWLGVWPAVVGFVLLVGVTENLTGIPQSPRLTAGVLAAYAVLMLLGGLAFGRTFFDRADALAVLYALLGRVSPLEWRERGVVVRPPWAACARTPSTPGVAAFVVAAVYTVTFDGFSNSPEYQTVYFALRDATGAVTPLALYVAGLAAFLVAFAVVALAADRLGSGRSVRGAAAAFAPTVVPIAAAYEVAHNYSFVARNLSQLLSLVDGVSVSLLGWLPLSAFWWSQVALVVAGHLLAVAAAHLVVSARYGKHAGRAHAPLVALMVGYTVLSLWVVSRPVVT